MSEVEKIVRDLARFERYDSIGRCSLCGAGTEGLPISAHDPACLKRRAVEALRKPVEPQP